MTDYLHALPSGYRIEEYELVRVLGSGGFGITYLGYDHHLDKAVAIKEYLPNDLAVRADNRSVLPKSAQDRADYEWGLERFLTEAQTLARFDHRHIIKIHRFFRAHGTGYSVMEYAEGETLSEVLQRKGTLTEAELKAILFPILDGLEAVHEADFLHRDIKPGNIVIRDDGSPVLIDFGSARQAVAGKSRSVTAIVTPGYAPIEQYSAKGHQGPWTDIYGLGAVCYRCLAGEAPDDATERLRKDPLVPASKRCKGKASASLLDSIDRALRVDEGERPQTITEWREVLVDGGESRKRSTKTVTRSAESSATAHTGMSWLSMTLVAVIVVLLGASAWQGWNLYRQMPRDGVGGTAAVEKQQPDVALDTQAGNEMDAASGTASTVTGQPAVEPEASLSPRDLEGERIGITDTTPTTQKSSSILTDSQEEYFTQGSHEDDVLKLQGTPSSIDRYESSGYERWHFGSNMVEVDLQTRRVRGWINSGELNVRLFPGKQVTSETYFTRDSHEDDVLRLQGTPSVLGRGKYEVLGFDSGVVWIDLQTRRVWGWANIGGELKLNVRLFPGKQATSEPYFTRGSHEDDVLRLQGTPSSLTQSSSYENWRFGRSLVRIDLQTRRVLGWNNRGNLKVKL